MHISFAPGKRPEQSGTAQRGQNRGHDALYEALWELETLLDTKLDFLRGINGKKLRVEKFRIKRLALSQNRYFEEGEDLISERGYGVFSEQIAVEFAEKLEGIKQNCPYLEMIEGPHFEAMEGPHSDMINQTVSFSNLEAFESYDTFYDDDFRDAYSQVFTHGLSTIRVRTKLYRPYHADALESTGDRAQLQCFECMGFEVSFGTTRNSLKHHFPLSVEKLLRIKGSRSEKS